MFEGRFNLAVTPDGGVVLPPGIRKEMHRLWGQKAALLCFGVQFLYVCRADKAEGLLERIDQQLCAAFGDKNGINAYFRQMAASVKRLEPAANGSFALPRRLMELLGVPGGGLVTLLGVEDHLELWNKGHLERQSRNLERLMQSRAPRAALDLLELPICLQDGETPCSLSRAGTPDPRRCGPCVWLRVP
ncbi:MAG: hypothetical protein LBG83_08755 [Oscillospiraceae bacterium]|nr:hypothetical protein [Oscillospiraceae bacterium]